MHDAHTYWLKVEKRLPDRYRFRAEVGLSHLEGNPRPYWSATGELLNMARAGENRLEACGAMGDEIREHFPHLAPVVALHLSDDLGVPMHAAANGAYWLGLASWGARGPMAPDDDYGRRALETGPEGLVWAPAVAASHLRLTLPEVRELRARVMAAGEHRATRLEELAAVVAELGPRWLAEADAARELLEGLGALHCRPFTPAAQS